jgi:hypothetical protein
LHGDVSTLRGRVRLTSTNTRWAATVFASLALAGAVDALGLPGGLATGAALAMSVLGVGDLVFEIIVRRRTMVAAGLEKHLSDERGLMRSTALRSRRTVICRPRRRRWLRRASGCSRSAVRVLSDAGGQLSSTDVLGGFRGS